MFKLFTILFALLFISGRAYAQEPSFNEWYRQALVLKKENKCTDAIVLLEKMLQQQPSNKEVIYELGWCFNELRQFEKALHVLTTVQALVPADYRLIYERGYSKAALGKAEEAIKDYDLVINWSPGFAAAYTAKAEVYKDQLKNTQEALQWYLKALEKDTGNKKSLYWAGWCYNDLGQYKNALSFLNKVSDFPDFKGLAYTELGFSYFSLGSYQLAIDLLLKADLLRPKTEVIHYYLGMCYVKTGKKPEAVKKYNELVLVGSEYAISLLNEIKNMK